MRNKNREINSVFDICIRNAHWQSEHVHFENFMRNFSVYERVRVHYKSMEYTIRLYNIF